MKTIVIMAAGIGSRFGGLKQIEPVGPSEEIIADYSVYDAKKAGFERIVFIIRKEHEEYFKENIISKYNGIEVKLAYQELDILPNGVSVPKDRTKILGTAHALWCAKDYLDDDFIIINSDDFYGFESFKLAMEFFLNNKNTHEYMSVNYPFYITKSINDSVKRGVVIENNGYIKEINECEITGFVACSLVNNKQFMITKDTPVSVNFFCLRPNFLNILEEKIIIFLKQGIKNEEEIFMPEILKESLEENKCKILSKTSPSLWMGMTYKEDLYKFKANINKLIKEGKYPETL